MPKKILAILAALFTTLALAAVDVNKASEAELDGVKGIGPGTSKLILAERKKGEFKSWDDFISRVKGVGEKRAENLSEAGLTVGGKAYKPATSAAAVKPDDKGRKDAKAEAKADRKDAKAEAKAEKKEARAEAKAEAKAAKKDDKVASGKMPAGPASAARK